MCELQYFLRYCIKHYSQELNGRCETGRCQCWSGLVVEVRCGGLSGDLVDLT